RQPRSFKESVLLDHPELAVAQMLVVDKETHAMQAELRQRQPCQRKDKIHALGPAGRLANRTFGSEGPLNLAHLTSILINEHDQQTAVSPCLCLMEKDPSCKVAL